MTAWSGGRDALGVGGRGHLSGLVSRAADRRDGGHPRGARTRGAVPADADGHGQRHRAVLHRPRRSAAACSRRAISPKKTIEGAVGGFVFGGAHARGGRQLVAARGADAAARRRSASAVVALRDRRRPVRVDVEAQRRREGQLDADSRATAASSIASTRCCSPRRSTTSVLSTYDSMTQGVRRAQSR